MACKTQRRVQRLKLRQRQRKGAMPGVTSRKGVDTVNAACWHLPGRHTVKPDHAALTQRNAANHIAATKCKPRRRVCVAKAETCQHRFTKYWKTCRSRDSEHFFRYPGIGIEYQQFGLYLDATYTPETFGTASNTTSLLTPAGKPDSRFGKTDAALIVDLSTRWQATPNISLLAGISNLLGEEYLSSRIPLGPRAGEPRAFYTGVEIKF